MIEFIGLANNLHRSQYLCNGFAKKILYSIILYYTTFYFIEIIEHAYDCSIVVLPPGCLQCVGL